MNNQILNNCLNYINTLSIIDISYTNITNKGLKYLKGVHTINLKFCNQITDKGLEYLKGVHCGENLHNVGKGLKYLKDVHTIDLFDCNKITD